MVRGPRFDIVAMVVVQADLRKAWASVRSRRVWETLKETETGKQQGKRKIGPFQFLQSG